MTENERKLQRKLNVLQHMYGELEREVTRLRKTQLVHQEMPRSEHGVHSEVYHLDNVTAMGRYRTIRKNREGRMRPGTAPAVVATILNEEKP